jgi:hypothetical protein
MPNKFGSVAEYLDAQSPAVRDEVEWLRQLVMDAEPRIVEIVKWNSPSYTLDGQDRLTVNVGRSGVVRLVLHRGTAVAATKGAATAFVGDPTGLLTWHSDVRASLMAGVDRERAVAVVRAWLAG